MLADLYPKFKQSSIAAENEQSQTKGWEEQQNYLYKEISRNGKRRDIDITSLLHKANSLANKFAPFELKNNLVEEVKNKSMIPN